MLGGASSTGNAEEAAPAGEPHNEVSRRRLPPRKQHTEVQAREHGRWHVWSAARRGCRPPHLMQSKLQRPAASTERLPAHRKHVLPSLAHCSTRRRRTKPEARFVAGVAAGPGQHMRTRAGAAAQADWGTARVLYLDAVPLEGQASHAAAGELALHHRHAADDLQEHEGASPLSSRVDAWRAACAPAQHGPGFPAGGVDQPGGHMRQRAAPVRRTEESGIGAGPNPDLQEEQRKSTAAERGRSVQPGSQPAMFTVATSSHQASLLSPGSLLGASPSCGTTEGRTPPPTGRHPAQQAAAAAGGGKRAPTCIHLAAARRQVGGRADKLQGITVHLLH